MCVQPIAMATGMYTRRPTVCTMRIHNKTVRCMGRARTPDMTDLDIPDTGAVFTFGKSRFAENKPSHFFIKNDPVVHISCGDEHTAVICKNGRIFAFGSNEWGQLGLGHNNMVHKPSCVKSLKPEKAKFIACGRAHTIILTEMNNVYACGSNTDGQLGLENADMANYPTKVQSNLYDNGAIKKLSAGSQHSVALAENGKLYVWGSNSEGQLGLESNKTSCKTPTQLDFKEKIEDVSCGYYHTAIVTETGDLYTFGENENGKLGLPATDTQTYKPSRVPLEDGVRSVTCGGNHTTCLTRAGRVLVFGSNVAGELGLDKGTPWLNPPARLPDALFAGEKIAAVSCGENHTAFLTEGWKVYTCGDPRHGKLCQDDAPEELQYAPRQVARFQNYKVTSVACGGCHTIIGAQRLPEDALPPLQRVPNAMLEDSRPEEAKDLNLIAPDKEQDFMDSLDSNALDNVLKEMDEPKATDIILPENISEKIQLQSEELKKELDSTLDFELPNELEKRLDETLELDKKEAVGDIMNGTINGDLGETIKVGIETVGKKLKDETDKKYDSMDNLLQEIEDDLSGMSAESTTSNDTISVKSVAKSAPEPELPKIEKPADNDEEDLKLREPIQQNEKRISKFFSTFRRKKISSADVKTIENSVKEGMENTENMKINAQEKSDKSKACVIL